MADPQRSPYILQMYEWFDTPKNHILVLEFPDPCQTLEDFIKSNGGRLHELHARDLILQAILGVKDCIDRGVFHQSISLRNLLINTKTMQLKLIDFGSGELVDTDFDMDQYNGKCVLLCDVMILYVIL